MKFEAIVLTLCLSYAFSAKAQLTKIEKPFYGLADTVFYLKGSDTAYFETFHRNGILKSKVWKRDSFYEFYSEGNLFSRTIKQVDNTFGYDFEKIETYQNVVQSWTYNSSNELVTYESWQGDTAFTQSRYTPNGHLEWQRIWSKRISANGQYHQFYYSDIENKAKVKSIYQDTLTKTRIDSSFFKGILRRVSIASQDSQHDYYFDEKGELEYEWKSDSAQLHVDKDNGDCLYGFRNRLGDWVIPPQYDKVQDFNQDYFIVSKNDKYGIINDYGKVILPVDYDFLGIINYTGVMNGSIRVGFDDDFPDFTKLSRNTGIHSWKNNKHERAEKKHPLKYRQGETYGVMDFFKGEVLLPPQYEDVRYMKGDTFEVRMNKKWGLVDSKGRIIVQPQYYQVNFTHLRDVFEIRDTLRNNYYYSQEIKGLIDDKGKILLDMKFQDILPTQTNTFRLTTFYRSENSDLLHGVYDKKRGWLMDTVFQDRSNGIYVYFKRHPIILDSFISKKYGYVNEDYKTILPFEYDHIEAFYNEKTILICKKDKKYGIFDENTQKWLIPLKYDFIHSFIEKGTPLRFLALKDNQWRWIDENDHLLSDDILDYAGLTLFEYNNILFTIKNDKVSFHLSDFYPQNYPLGAVIDKTDRDLIELEDFKKGKIYINRKGHLVIPPQYSVLSRSGAYAIAKDTQGKQTLIDIEGHKRPFLPQYKVEVARIEKNFVIVQDTVKKTYGVLTPEGATILPCRYYDVSDLDSFDIIWAKESKSVVINEQDTAKLKEGWYAGRDEDYIRSSDNYSLMQQDSGWLMFNKKGDLLTKTAFAFPFDISNGHGVGVVRSSVDRKIFKMGIWRADGVNILPPQYDRLFFDDFNNLYMIYQNGADGKMKVGICDSTGRILIEPTLERLSYFNGHYAFAKTPAGVGIIMKNGQYKIPPQYHAFINARLDLDSLLCHHKDSTIQATKNKWFFQPYSYVKLSKRIAKLSEFVEDDDNPFSFLDTSRHKNRTILKNLIVDKISEGQFIDGKYLPFNRSKISSILKVIVNDDVDRRTYQLFNLHSIFFTIGEYFNLDDKNIGFALKETDDRIPPRGCIDFRSSKIKFFNFIPNGKNDWREIQIDDIIQINPDNSFKMNQLIIERIRNLKDAKIDCSNPNGYFEEVKNSFFKRDDGLEFYFNGRGLPYNETIKVFFTWAELKPFLKN